MSTLTKESIADTIEGLEQLVNRGIQSVHIDMAVAGMRRLLASLEAEAVLPAPISVPDEVLKMLLPDAEKAEFWFEHDGKILFEGVKFNNAVFEACRAAMLQEAE